MSYRVGMTAAEARDEGLEVPNSVPDVAVLQLAGDPEITVAESSSDKTVLDVKMFAVWNWSWIRLRFEV